ncbi:MAG: sugar phosphate isomerase/epimerase family protein [Phycisphaeraceae bacterium]
MATTRTGELPIGFRRGGSDWQTDFDTLLRFAQEAEFEVLDLPALPIDDLKRVLDAGLKIGTVDLPPPWADLAAEDPTQRSNAADRCAAYIKEAGALGLNRFFAVVLPEDPAQPREVNMDRAVHGYSQLCAALADTDARLLLEGWPGGPPHFGSLACTPADFRLFHERVGSERIGVNYDPSHLVRMGIDPIRFAHEFADRIHHVHAKDTELLDEALYEHGNLQPATQAAQHGFGAHHWRYTIPGHGCVRWSRILSVLVDAGYKGAVCIELEDENFNGTPDGERRGLTASRDFLVHV